MVCKFSGTNVAGTYTSEANVFRITEAALSVSPAACVSATPKLSADFSLETIGGGVVRIM